MTNKPRKENYYNVDRYINALMRYWNTNGGPSNRNQAIAREMQNYFNWRKQAAIKRMKFEMNRKKQNVEKDIRNLLNLKEKRNKLFGAGNNSYGHNNREWWTTFFVKSERGKAFYSIFNRILALKKKYDLKGSVGNVPIKELIDSILFQLIMIHKGLKNIGHNYSNKI